MGAPSLMLFTARMPPKTAVNTVLHMQHTLSAMQSYDIGDIGERGGAPNQAQPCAPIRHAEEERQIGISTSHHCW